ncbi:methyltransferase domain-containing protein [Bacillus sp. DTU_2020_1000418_1_SI_GHA_SEK_038]|uniref:class I SAM-dependent methyltransferase n=1 Tax=Bacillus sp. DTU_2020_1000418_1_SI_GHA_SEK_038 TaxID=3077585 RepID=UPI0028EBB0B1|nr:methyltransferase domain-containing protein [Bacillus sp. DTU_2020_1000418_1_SI_GHA_SEK_038]WNS76532.1 methyltransferase domain-containing protein [Bacillus sp. DTU_2020_1000418_1_SI_GHA_SEK_038]
MTFYQVLSQYYDDIFPSNPAQLSFIKSVINNKAKLLDIAAGAGNQAIELAKSGYNVTAVDLDQKMVEKIEQKRTGHQVNLTALKLDMRDINHFKDQSFDAAICIGNSIVHLESHAEISKTLKKISNVLAEDGILIIQTVNYDRVLQHHITDLPLIELPNKGIIFKRTYDHFENKINFNGTLTVNQSSGIHTYTNSVELYPLTSNELNESLIMAGFRKVELFGDFKGSEYSPDSPALIGIAYK